MDNKIAILTICILLLFIIGVWLGDVLLKARCQTISDTISAPTSYAGGSCFVKYPSSVTISEF